jgi:hypothetical protein
LNPTQQIIQYAEITSVITGLESQKNALRTLITLLTALLELSRWDFLNVAVHDSLKRICSELKRTGRPAGKGLLRRSRAQSN